MIHKQMLFALMAAYPVHYFLLATVIVIVTVWLTMNAKNKGE